LYQQAALTLGWNPWLDAGWHQQSLANSFSTMALHPPPTSVQDWVADSGVTHRTTPSVGNISTLRPLASSNPLSIVVDNDSSLPITSVGDSVLPGPFYLNNILFAPDMIQNLLSVGHFTIDNWCSMEFDLFGLSVKDLITKNVIVRSNSTSPLYMMCLPGSLTLSSSAVAALAAVPHALTVVAPTTWHRRLGHPGSDALSSLSRSSFIQCTSNKYDFCHACQLGKHTRFPFCSSSHRAEHAFDLMHLDLWTSPVVSVSGSKYYLVILDDFTQYLWTFPLKLKSDTFIMLSNFFAYMSNQFGGKVKAIQCDNGREFDNSSIRIFLLSNGTQLWMSCPYTSSQNGKVECIIRFINNVIRTLLIQTSLPGHYWPEGLHTATYLLNCLPTKAIQVACLHIALFRFAPSYEHF
jgi:IS30 family transposase